ncbi:uncharacterized protein CIMG_12793 [Coccidioides immitis RS]|uniref:Uncharacterized protein n=1 Tax=Coccidioides immitis (strain RS) TaxID=246410 RepID=A0A0D8JTA9_COCIM|nr:uncharacterized protein CIMG_12793 [Coccidioides immitis RS]KJF60181.1 hypothetical protein CIMG_12793 [Coccidioides immitis RS]
MGMEQFRRKSVQGRRSVSAQNPLIVVGHRGRRGQRRLPAKTKRSLDQNHQKMDEFRTHILAALITTVNLNKSARQWMPRHEYRGAIAQRTALQRKTGRDGAMNAPLLKKLCPHMMKHHYALNGGVQSHRWGLEEAIRTSCIMRRYTPSSSSEMQADKIRVALPCKKGADKMHERQIESGEVEPDGMSRHNSRQGLNQGLEPAGTNGQFVGDAIVMIFAPVSLGKHRAYRRSKEC